MNLPERLDEHPHIANGLRLRGEHRRELRDLLGMPRQVLLEVDVDQIRRERADRLDVRVLGAAEAWPVEVGGEDAEVGDAGDVVARADVEQRLGERGHERDDAPRRRGEFVLAAEDVVNDHGAMVPNPQDVLPLPSLDVEQYRKRAEDLVAGGEAALSERRTLEEAQFIVARMYGFAGWPELVRHLEQGGDDTAFERAVDAIVTGDVDTLAALLRAHPELVTARSSRAHGATLLHYVSANGVENYRQRTPPNIVAITRRLLDAGAEVDATCDVYRGDATTLYLTVTSAHPRAAGVQNELADLLLARGAQMHPGILRDCLANGCPEAAAHLLSVGAPTLSLEEAAGLGDGAAVRRLLAEALNMAAWYDRRDVVALLLERGAEIGTPLHIAAYCGHAELVRLLLDHGAPVNVADEVYGTTPIVWALHAWLTEGKGPEARYHAVLKDLAEHGATVEPRYLEDERVRAVLGPSECGA